MRIGDPITIRKLGDDIVIRYVIADSDGRFIMKNAANQYIPVPDIELAERFDSMAKAKNILNSCINRNIRKRMSVMEIEEPDRKECVKPDSNNPAPPCKHHCKAKQSAMRKLASQDIAEENLTFSREKILNAIGDMEAIHKRKLALQDEHSKIEKEIVDIEHYIELCDNLNAYQGYLAYMMLRKRLQLRRHVKDEILVLSDIEDVMSGLRRTVSKMNSLDGRSYEPRVLTELFT